jgi:IS5 family transposase
MDNRHGLVVNTRRTQANGNAEPGAALAMAAEITGQGRVTLGADKGYDQREFVRALREHRVTPHAAQKAYSAIDDRTTRHPGYALSQC